MTKCLDLFTKNINFDMLCTVLFDLVI